MCGSVWVQNAELSYVGGLGVVGVEPMAVQ
jgi:hypothetical protein